MFVYHIDIYNLFAASYWTTLVSENNMFNSRLYTYLFYFITSYI